MAGEKHLKYFCVENFKRFERLELDNIGQFNLIGGDNNVGKTTLLEALLLEEEDLGQTFLMLQTALNARKMLGNPANSFKWTLDLYRSQKAKDEPTIFYLKQDDSKLHKYELNYRSVDYLSADEIKSVQSQLVFNQGIKEVLEVNSDGHVAFEIPSFKDYIPPIIFINTGTGEVLVNAYSSQIQNSVSEEAAFIQDLRSFIPDVVGLGISNTILATKQNTLIVRLKNQDNPLPLLLFGEGSIKLFRILIAITTCKGRRLMIDEIDTGIHHSRFKIFWKTILKAAKKNDVQIFATTHNRECLKFLKETLEEPDMQSLQTDTRYFLLHEESDNSVKAINYSFPQFQFAIDNDNELRS